LNSTADRYPGGAVVSVCDLTLSALARPDPSINSGQASPKEIYLSPAGMKQ
jgi:hypothetical protein